MTIYTVKMATVLDSGWLPRLIGTVIYQILPTRNQCCRIRQTFLFNVKVFLFQQGLTLVLQFFFFLYTYWFDLWVRESNLNYYWGPVFPDASSLFLSLSLAQTKAFFFSLALFLFALLWIIGSFFFLTYLDV